MAMEIALRYIATVAVVGAAVWYYGGFDRIVNQYILNTSQATKSGLVEKTARKKKAKNKLNEPVNSGTDSASVNEKKRKISSPVEGTVTASTSGKDEKVSLPRVEDVEVEDKEWARQLQQKQQGISFVSFSKQNGAKSRIRTVKQSTADEDSPDVSAGNSSTGQDGDDEITPAQSPAFTAVADTVGISDMLETPAEGPKTLRLTGFEEVKTKKQSVAAKAPEPVETKRQRQQRQKREEEKERNAQSAKEHQAKGQQQMRTARLADGTSKQTRTDSFKPQANVWSAKENVQQESAVKQPPPDGTAVAPLDTFEPQAAATATHNGAVTAQPLATLQGTQSSSTNANGLRQSLGSQKVSALAASERESLPQTAAPLERTTSAVSWADEMEMNKDEREKLDDTWEEVTNTKKDKKKAKKESEHTDGDSSKSAKVVNEQAQKSFAAMHTNGASVRAQPRPQAVNRYKSLDTEATKDALEDSAWEA